MLGTPRVNVTPISWYFGYAPAPPAFKHTRTASTVPSFFARSDFNCIEADVAEFASVTTATFVPAPPATISEVSSSSSHNPEPAKTTLILSAVDNATPGVVSVNVPRLSFGTNVFVPPLEFANSIVDATPVAPTTVTTSSPPVGAAYVLVPPSAPGVLKQNFALW